MDKQDKPRLAEVLGVEVGEKFTIKGHAGDKAIFYVNEKGIMCWNGVGVDNVTAIFTAINHPEYIIRAPRLTEPEIAIMRAVGARWVSRDDNSVTVNIWSKKPEKHNGWYEMLFSCVCSIDPCLFPSVHPGDCIELEDAQ